MGRGKNYPAKNEDERSQGPKDRGGRIIEREGSKQEEKREKCHLLTGKDGGVSLVQESILPEALQQLLARGEGGRVVELPKRRGRQGLRQ